MTKRLLALLLILNAAFLFASQNRKVLLIGIDGTRSDAFQLANTPHIDGLLATSTYSYDSWHTGITMSGPSWTTILTGVQWNKHLVTGNSFSANDFTTYPPFPTLAKQVYPNLNCSIVAEWDPLIDNITNAGWNRAIKARDESTWPTADSAIIELQNPDLDLLFVYFDSVDMRGHYTTFSPTNPVYVKAIEGVDSAVGNVLNALYARPTYAAEDWLILVVTDHGGTSFFHGGNSVEERQMWWIASGSAVAHQQITKADPGTYNCGSNLVYDTACVDLPLLKNSPTHPDVAVTALHHLIYESGINPETKPEWNLDGKSWLLTPTGIDEVGVNGTFFVYPNPVAEELTVRGLQFAVEKQIPVELFSVDGKKVWSVTPTANTIAINVQNFAKGIYLLKVGTATKKIAVE